MEGSKVMKGPSKPVGLAPTEGLQPLPLGASGAEYQAVASANGSNPRPAPSRDPASAPQGHQHHGRSKPWRVEGMPEHHDEGEGVPPPPHWKEFLRRSWWFLILALLANWLILSLVLGGGTTCRTAVSYSFFHQQVLDHNVSEVTTKGDSITGAFRDDVSYPPKDDSATKVKDFESERPAFSNDHLVQQLLESGAKVSAEQESTGSSWTDLLIAFVPTLLIIGLLVWLFRRGMAAAGAGLGGFGRSRARLYEPETSRRTTFEDVAGIDEVKAEVMEIVDFLRDPDRFRRLGAQIPRGVLLTGAPGTGKTLLARAVAGEAAVPFLSVSASEFIEMIVGVGASRVRDLFEQAKKVAPSIIFIDELDAIGRARGGRDQLQRSRRARADAQPDPHRDGRVHRQRGRGRAGRHQPTRDPRPCPAAGRQVRPSHRREPTRPGRPATHPRGAHPRCAAVRFGVTRTRRVRHVRHGRRRAQEPRQRGRPAGSPAFPREGREQPTSPTRSNGSFSAPPARS